MTILSEDHRAKLTLRLDKELVITKWDDTPEETIPAEEPGEGSTPDTLEEEAGEGDTTEENNAEAVTAPKAAKKQKSIKIESGTEFSIERTKEYNKKKAKWDYKIEVGLSATLNVSQII